MIETGRRLKHTAACRGVFAMRETILQFGEGNFLRGFADSFIQKLSDQGLYDGKIVVVQPIAHGMAQVLNAQGGVYNLYLRGVENGREVCEHTRIDRISRAINPYEDFEGFLALAANPELRFIFSNTTEAGIRFDAACKRTDRPPASFPGKLTLLLWERFRLGLPGFALFACELIDRNAEQLKRCVLRYAAQWKLGERFAQWVERENYFCNTLVDRIVTGYPKEEAPALCRELGWEDRLLDTAEPFHLWVIEGDFERELPLQRAGCHVVWAEDVAPYQKRKVRVLNGAHTSVVCAALLAGLETVEDCMRDPLFSAFLQQCIFGEILPTLGETRENLAFANAVLERFYNPYLHHRLDSIVLNCVSKFAVRVLPTILEYREQAGMYPRALVLSLAALLSFYQMGEPKDAPEIIALLREASTAEILSNASLWGMELSSLLPQVQAGQEALGRDVRGAVAAVLSN